MTARYCAVYSVLSINYRKAQVLIRLVENQRGRAVGVWFYVGPVHVEQNVWKRWKLALGWKLRDPWDLWRPFSSGVMFRRLVNFVEVPVELLRHVE